MNRQTLPGALGENSLANTTLVLDFWPPEAMRECLFLASQFLVICSSSP